MSLKHKFLIIFTCISIIPILLITTYVYNRYTDLINQQSIRISDNIATNAQNKLNERLTEINDMTSTFQLYTENTYSVIEDIKKYTEADGSYTYYDIAKSRNNMRFICQSLIYSNDFINGIFIFTPSGVTIGYGWGNNIDIRPDYVPFNDQWYLDTIALNGKLYIGENVEKEFIINSKNSISFAKCLYDVYTHKFLGVLFIDCSSNVFDLSSVNTLAEMAVLTVVNENKSILYSTNPNLKEIPNVVEDQTKDHYIIEMPLEKSQIKVNISIAMSQLNSKFGYTKNTLIIIVVTLSVVLTIISLILSFSLTRPITQLSDWMRDKSKKGPIMDNKNLNKVDEIGVLYNEYNIMINEINHYIKDELQNKLILLDTQMKSLEAQINSHFLYNTLEAINSIAEIENVNSISTIALALGDMFRYSINTKSELVTLEDELRHVRNYVSIQEIRFNYRFSVNYEIEETLRNKKILKLILQPIVENALYHGLNRCAVKGEIKIQVYEEEETLYVTISDNGLGMTDQQQESIRNLLAKPSSFTALGHRTEEGIGLKNIHSRIQLYYGRQYGLRLTSKINEGTAITVNLPIIKEEKQ